MSITIWGGLKLFAIKVISFFFMFAEFSLAHSILQAELAEIPALTSTSLSTHQVYKRQKSTFLDKIV